MKRSRLKLSLTKRESQQRKYRCRTRNKELGPPVSHTQLAAAQSQQAGLLPEQHSPDTQQSTTPLPLPAQDSSTAPPTQELNNTQLPSSPTREPHTMLLASPAPQGEPRTMLLASPAPQGEPRTMLLASPAPRDPYSKPTILAAAPEGRPEDEVSATHSPALSREERHGDETHGPTTITSPEGMPGGEISPTHISPLSPETRPGDETHGPTTNISIVSPEGRPGGEISPTHISPLSPETRPGDETQGPTTLKSPEQKARGVVSDTHISSVSPKARPGEETRTTNTTQGPTTLLSPEGRTGGEVCVSPLSPGDLTTTPVLATQGPIPLAVSPGESEGGSENGRTEDKFKATTSQATQQDTSPTATPEHTLENVDQTDSALELFWSQVSLEAVGTESSYQHTSSHSSTIIRGGHTSTIIRSGQTHSRSGRSSTIIKSSHIRSSHSKQSVVKKQTSLYSFMSVRGENKKHRSSGTGLNGLQQKKFEPVRGMVSAKQRKVEPATLPSSSRGMESGKVERGMESGKVERRMESGKVERGMESGKVERRMESGKVERGMESGKVERRMESEKVERVRKSCPFYKRIPGTTFSVDAFSYGTIPDCSAYFLSHFHADHYGGLKKSFSHSIYCSTVTANLVQQRLKVSAEYIHPLSLDQPVMVEGVEVTFLDANHCPGSVLILFRLKSGQNYLHTGDFRFTPGMLLYPPLLGLSIHQLYLDTTYCDPRYTFPPQEEVVAFAVEKCLNTLHSCPNTLVVCGTYTIGKEKVFRAIADVLGVKICVSMEKKATLDCLECPSLSERLTTDYSQSPLHVLPMAKLNLRALGDYFNNWSGTYSRLLAFKPTGWTFSGPAATDLTSLQPQVRGPVLLYGIPYSEHSSYSELRGCVQGLKPLKIIPTVNNGSAQKREEMQRTFQIWQQENERKSQSLVQSKLKISSGQK